MANKALIDITTGLIQSVITPSSSSLMPEGMLVGGFEVKDLPADADMNTARGSTHWDFVVSGWATHEPRMTLLDDWDNIDKRWVLNVERYADEKYLQIKTDLYMFITQASKFPEWKQANYADTWSELSIKKLTSGVTADEQATIDAIQQTRDWKNTLLVERDRVKGEIYAAVDEIGIQQAFDSMIHTSAPFSL